MITSGVFERFPDLKFVGSEVHTGWVPYYLERFDESVRRNRAEWTLPLLPSEYFRRNVSVVYIVDEMGAANRYDIGVGNIMWGPDFPHSSRSWPVDYQLGREILERAGATAGEIERIMWRNAADTYKMPYDEPASVAAAAKRGVRSAIPRCVSAVHQARGILPMRTLITGTDAEGRSCVVSDGDRATSAVPGIPGCSTRSCTRPPRVLRRPDCRHWRRTLTCSCPRGFSD